MTPALGLHARPAARFVGAVSEFDAQVEVSNATRSRGPADARSLTGIATLGVRQGDEIVVRASGEQAAAVLDALRALAADNFGDPPDTARRWRSRPARADASAGGHDGCGGRAGDRGRRAGRHRGRRAPAAPAPGTRLRGIPASAGIAIGPARRLRPQEPPVDAEPAGSPDEERARLDAARDAVRADLEAAKATVAARAGGAEAEIFTAHALLLDDTALTGPAHDRVAQGESAGRAWQAAGQEAAAAFRALDDPVLQERAVDVEDVARRVLARLAGTPAGAAIAGPGIVVAGELTPGEAAGLDPERRVGDRHRARRRDRARRDPRPGARHPGGRRDRRGARRRARGHDARARRRGRHRRGGPRRRRRRRQQTERRDAAAAEREALLARAAEPGQLADGRRVEVFANIGSPAEARKAVEQGAEGVGLLRTEFLFLDRAEPPDEDEQVAVLREIATALDGRPLVVRTLDAGADKPLPFLRQEPEDNPFLGRRGIRLSLARPDLFRTQLRAILRVAAEHPLAVMFPMVATLDEVRAARAELDAAREELGSSAALEVGVMVEVPGTRPAGRRVRGRGGLLLRRDERPRAVHDGGGARERGARGPARGRPLAGARPDRRGDRRGEPSTAAGSGSAASWPASRRPRCCSPGSACASSAWRRAGFPRSRPRCARPGSTRPRRPRSGAAALGGRRHRRVRRRIDPNVRVTAATR